MNEFNTIANKGFLWKLMFENGVFQDINENYVKNIKTLFDEKIAERSRWVTSTDRLIDINKQVITSMVQDISKYKMDSSLSSMEINKINNPTALISAAEISAQKQTVFQKGLELKKTEFNQLNQRPVPPEIDFSDAGRNEDKPIGPEMEQMIANAIAWRKQELNMVLESQDPAAATKWLNHSEEQQTNRHIKIGGETILNTQVIYNLDKNEKHEKKKVSFLEPRGHPPAPQAVNPPADLLRPVLQSAPQADTIEPVPVNPSNDFLNSLKKNSKSDDRELKEIKEDIHEIKTTISALHQKLLELIAFLQPQQN
jgi:hypothetical protein